MQHDNQAAADVLVMEGWHARQAKRSKSGQFSSLANASDFVELAASFRTDRNMSGKLLVEGGRRSDRQPDPTVQFGSGNARVGRLVSSAIA
jgi:hypothetical protein